MYQGLGLYRSEGQCPLMRITRVSVGLSLALSGSCLQCMGEHPQQVSQSAARLEGAAGIPAANESSARVDGGTDGTWSGSSSPVSASVTIAEVKMDPPGTDGNYEFVELSGEPSSQLSGYWLLAIEGDSDANPGQIDLAIDLAQCASGPCQLDPQGLLVIVADPLATTPLGGAAWYSAKELANGKLENGTTTLMAVVGFSSSDLGSDWDADDDGVLELPADVTVRHAVAWTDGNSGDRAYSAEIAGPKPKAQAAWRCIGAEGTATWRWGELQGDAPSLIMDLPQTFPQGLEHAALTPGGVNDCGTPGASIGLGAPEEGPAAGASQVVIRSDATSLVGAGGIERQKLDTCAYNDPQLGTSTAGNGGTASAVSRSPNSGAGTGAQTTSSHARATLGGSPPAATGCSGRTGHAPIVALALPQAGSSGWWSPNPFASPFGGTAHIAATTKVASSPEAKDSDPPQLPGSCAVRKSSRHGAPNPFLLAATCWALVRVRRLSRAVR